MQVDWTGLHRFDTRWIKWGVDLSASRKRKSECAAQLILSLCLIHPVYQTPKAEEINYDGASKIVPALRIHFRWSRGWTVCSAFRPRWAARRKWLLLDAVSKILRTRRSVHLHRKHPPGCHCVVPAAAVRLLSTPVKWLRQRKFPIRGIPAVKRK